MFKKAPIILLVLLMLANCGPRTHPFVAHPEKRGEKSLIFARVAVNPKQHCNLFFSTLSDARTNYIPGDILTLRPSRPDSNSESAGFDLDRQDIKIAELAPGVYYIYIWCGNYNASNPNDVYPLNATINIDRAGQEIYIGDFKINVFGRYNKASITGFVKSIVDYGNHLIINATIHNDFQRTKADYFASFKERGGSQVISKLARKL